MAQTRIPKSEGRKKTETRNPKRPSVVSDFGLRPSEIGFRRLAAGGSVQIGPELLVAVIVTLIRPPPSLYWEWRLGAGVRPGDWIGSAPGLKAGDKAAERGSWRAGGVGTGDKRAQREEPKSQEHARNILGTCLQHASYYWDDPVEVWCWQGEACGLGPTGWLGCLAATAFRSHRRDASGAAWAWGQARLHRPGLPASRVVQISCAAAATSCII
jgi:hypothetical protein